MLYEERFDSNPNLDIVVIKIAQKRTSWNINSGPNLRYYELVPVVNHKDSYDSWQEDHLNDHIKLWLKMENNEPFPTIWKTTSHVGSKIYCFSSLRKIKRFH